MNKKSIIQKVSGDFVMPFGKYKGKTLDDIAEENIKYIFWLNENEILYIEKEFLDACYMDYMEENELDEVLSDYRDGNYGNRD